MPKVNEIKEKLKDQNSEDSMSDGNDKTINKILIILVSIFIGLVAVGCLAIIIYPKLTEKPEITIPDVSGLTVVEAEKQLEKLGFVVSNDVEEKHNSDIEEGKVIGTKPQVGRSVKKGTTVTLIVSLGSRGITLEDYVGKNYYEVKATLEAVGINVIIEEKEVEDKTNVKADIIIEQSIEPGTELTEGDTIILYIPDIVTEYPDFVTEGWSVKEIEAFCDEYDINLNINYQETEEYPDGTVLAQSFPAGRRVVPNTTLTITVATLQFKNLLKRNLQNRRIMEGRIIKVISNDYSVLVNNQIYICKPRGKFRNIKITPLVGDIVTFDPINNYL